jgi:hypothetical protein
MTINATYQDIKRYKAIYFAVSSFQEVSNDQIAELSQLALHSCIWFFADRPNLQGAYLGWGVPGKTRKILIHDSPEDWQRLRMAGEIDSFGIQTEWDIAVWGEVSDKVWLSIQKPDNKEKYSTDLFFCCEAEAIFEGPPSMEYQECIVRLAKTFYEEVSGIGGYITYDYGGPSVSPYERIIKQPPGRRNFREQLRGYYWGNFLNARHVELLGGEQQLYKAPVKIIEKIGKGYYLQIKEDVSQVTRDDVLSLREFLQPLLPQKHPDDPPYTGPNNYLL